MLYFFTWNNHYLIRQEVLRWKYGFGIKQSEDVIHHINDLSSISSEDLRDTLVARSFLSEKRMIIIDDFPYSSEKSFSWASEKESLILKMLPHIPEENIVIFSSLNPDKRGVSYKKIIEYAKVTELSIKNIEDTKALLSKKYEENISMQNISKILLLKWNNYEKTLWEIEKLLLTRNYIEQNDIEKHISPEFEESIFVFIDSILEKNPKRILRELQNILQFTNFYAFYQSLLANIRIFVFIEYFKSYKKSQSEIVDIMKLWNRQFLVGKRHASSFFELKKLYTHLIDFDKSMKTWKFISSDERYLVKEIEAIFLKFLS